LYDKELAHFQVSITSTDDKKALEYENASLTSERIKSIEKLNALGFDVSVRLSPFIMENVDTTIINKIKCDKILIEFLKINHNVKNWFNIKFNQYTVKFGGYENLPLELKIEQVNKIKSFEQVSVGEYVKEHHEYFKNNVNFNKEDCCNLCIKTKASFYEGQQFELKLPEPYQL
jgi:DNA repair photolyase